MPKILVLTPRIPYPLEGGDKIRIYHVAKALRAAGFELTLLSFIAEPREADFGREPELSAVFSSVETVLLPKWKSWLNVIAGFFGSQPLQVSYYRSRAMQTAADRELASGKFAGVLVHLIRMAPYAASRPGPRKVLEMTDALSLTYARSKGRGSRGFLSLVYRFEKKRVKAYEQKCIGAFDCSVVVSARDRDYLVRGLDGEKQARVKVVPIGVPRAVAEKRTASYDPDLIIFIGNLRTYPNNDSVLYFAREIYPLIKAARPGAKLKIIGASPSRVVRALGGGQGIEVTGRVPDIVAAAERAGVSVCPMRIGAGMKGKILESMALGIPVVTTAQGAEGIEGAVPGEHYLAADTPRSFADAVLKLMGDSGLNLALGEKGRDFVSRRYRYDTVSGAYADFFKAS